MTFCIADCGCKFYSRGRVEVMGMNQLYYSTPFEIYPPAKHCLKGGGWCCNLDIRRPRFISVHIMSR
ncbi:hypothetical protein BX600DRAFT_455687 [Xylariales sp. PMI_506]|nr:hypothetical protein BX600DRAFT_455687 [Xylariales sp. PMI_506]